jgi:hypothetical protein
LNNYYGANCENEVDLCSNITCSRNGICKIDKNKQKSYCYCFKYYSGDECEIKSNELKAIEAVISTSSIVSIISIIVFYLLFIFNDIINNFFCKLNIKIKSKKKKLQKNRI